MGAEATIPAVCADNKELVYFIRLPPEVRRRRERAGKRGAQEYQARIANVSVRIVFENRRMDLVAGRRREGGDDHSLWRAREGTWQKLTVCPRSYIGHLWEVTWEVKARTSKLLSVKGEESYVARSGGSWRNKPLRRNVENSGNGKRCLTAASAELRPATRTSIVAFAAPGNP